MPVERTQEEVLFLGIDIGSTYGKAVAMSDRGAIVAKAIRPTGLGGERLAWALRDDVVDQLGGDPSFAYTVATGYGRVNVGFADKVLTEISCHARGVHQVVPEARVLVDIGGQDSKVIVLGPRGDLEEFVMNDKCAAGTGRFLEVMAKALEVEVSGLGALSLLSETHVEISSTCTVFAESEIISLLAKGIRREDIIAGLHRAIANRVFGLLKGRMLKIGSGALVVTGGVAQNEGILRALEEKVGRKIVLPGDPQFTGAIGSAVIARDEKNRARAVA
ncbi:MAG: 2-hydroxyglutaryl-CoA dehydratase [Deltaproteobacteria bacterium]|nr:2-hydroxyglutaryl-CoA dehydratase [Deltaproteobacteria bacterium]